jgi:hypothetical protein
MPVAVLAVQQGPAESVCSLDTALLAAEDVLMGGRCRVVEVDPVRRLDLDLLNAVHDKDALPAPRADQPGERLVAVRCPMTGCRPDHTNTTHREGGFVHGTPTPGAGVQFDETRSMSLSSPSTSLPLALASESFDADIP